MSAVSNEGLCMTVWAIVTWQSGAGMLREGCLVSFSFWELSVICHIVPMLEKEETLLMTSSDGISSCARKPLLLISVLGAII